jgi:hypothetical protein
MHGAIAQAVSCRLLTAAARVRAHVRSCGTLGQVSSEYFGFPCQFLFHQMLHTHPPSGAGTVGQLVANARRGLSLTPPQESKKKIITTWCNVTDDMKLHSHSHENLKCQMRKQLTNSSYLRVTYKLM